MSTGSEESAKDNDPDRSSLESDKTKDNISPRIVIQRNTGLVPGSKVERASRLLEVNPKKFLIFSS